MKNLLLMMLVFGLGVLGGKQFFSESSDKLAASAADENKPLYWVAPMDKNYRRDAPGLSPMGMELVPVYDDAASGDDNHGVKISAVVENNLGVKVAPVSRERLAMPVNTLGVVQFDESRITHVHSRVEGWIERLGVAASGDRVTQGQTLFELYSPALVSAQEEYLAAVRSGNKHLIKASTSRLYALGITAAQVRALKKRRKVEQTISVTAEKDGIVIDLNVRQGMYIKPATEVMAFASLDSVWVMAEVFERQAYLVQPGQSVVAEMSAMPGKTWHGNVNYIYPELDAKTRTLRVRVRLANEDHALKPNMLMNIDLLARAEEETLSIPRQALIKAANHERVVLALGDGRYQSVVVESGLEGEASLKTAEGEEIEKRVQILKGLKQGDLVVSSAQFLIDSESNIDAELQRMTDAASRPQETDAEAQSKAGNKVITSGSVDQVMAVMGMVKITHEAIPEWDWPRMTMDFSLADSLDLGQFKKGEQLTFEIEKRGDWDFVISNVGEGLDQALMDRPAMNSMDHVMEHSMDSAMDHDMDHKVGHDSSQGAGQ